MKNFHKTSLVIILSLVVIVAGTFLGIVNPLSSKFFSIYQKNLNYSSHISAINEKLDYLSDMKENQDEISTANQKFSEFVPKTHQVEDVLVQLDALARASTNNLPSFSAEEEKEAEGEFKTTTISINLVGTYETIRSFINSLENLQRFAVIESLCISGSENMASAKITLTIYHHG